MTLQLLSKNCAYTTRINSGLTLAFVVNQNILVVVVFMLSAFINVIETEMWDRLSVPFHSFAGALDPCTRAHMNYFKNIPGLFKDIPVVCVLTTKQKKRRAGSHYHDAKNSYSDGYSVNFVNHCGRRTFH